MKQATSIQGEPDTHTETPASSTSMPRWGAPNFLCQAILFFESSALHRGLPPLTPAQVTPLDSWNSKKNQETNCGSVLPCQTCLWRHVIPRTSSPANVRANNATEIRVPAGRQKREMKPEGQSSVVVDNVSCVPLALYLHPCCVALFVSSICRLPSFAMCLFHCSIFCFCSVHFLFLFAFRSFTVSLSPSHSTCPSLRRSFSPSIPPSPSFFFLCVCCSDLVSCQPPCLFSMSSFVPFFLYLSAFPSLIIILSILLSHIELSPARGSTPNRSEGFRSCS